MPLPFETFKIFISHAVNPDEDLVQWIADALDRVHIRAFVYERYQMGGQNRFDTIKTKIDEYPYFLVLLTSNGIASQWVNQEIGYAVARGKTPIPVVEIDPSSDRRLESNGFIELNDPINYCKGDEVGLMSQILYTMQGYAQRDRIWQDSIFLSCDCGYEFEGDLGFHDNWSYFTTKNKFQPFRLNWVCEKCGNRVWFSFPDCHVIE